MNPGLHVMSAPEQRREALHLDEAAILAGGRLFIAEGELDVSTVGALRDRLCAAAEQGVRTIVLDLRGVTFMDSIAMAAIVCARRKLGDDGRLAIVVEPGSYAMLIFEIAGRPAALELVETREQAFAGLEAWAAA